MALVINLWSDLAIVFFIMHSNSRTGTSGIDEVIHSLANYYHSVIQCDCSNMTNLTIHLIARIRFSRNRFKYKHSFSLKTVHPRDSVQSLFSQIFNIFSRANSQYAISLEYDSRMRQPMFLSTTHSSRAAKILWEQQHIGTNWQKKIENRIEMFFFFLLE